MENPFSFLEKWNFWSQKPNTGVIRKQHILQLDRFFNMSEIVVLTGVRRSGKSTILMQLIEHAHKKYEIPYQNFLYVNFEDPNFSLPVKTEEVYALIDFYKKEIKPKGKIYIFLDEVQEVLNWQRILLTHYEQKQDIKFFVTGSSSELFDSRPSTLLSGRTVNVKIAPLDFKEFLLFKKVKKTSPKICDLMNEYIQYGGFPRVVLEDNQLNKVAILSSYYNTILEKDVIVKFDIRKDLELRNLARYLMSNNGTITSSLNLEKSLQISSPSIISYMNFMKSSFLIHLNNLFSYSVKQQIYNPPKMYSVDTGLANIAGFNSALNGGLMLESLVNSVLYKDNRDVYYWKNAVKVDFVTNNGGEINLYNVTTTVDDDKVFEREIRSLEEGADKLKAKNTTLLTLYNNAKRNDPRVVNLLDFLLA